MTEYWLQKKTIGGWSNVTWYSDKAQAETNYLKLLSNKGYSYRLCEVQTIQEDLLDEVTEVQAPEIDIHSSQALPYRGGWDTPKPASNGWGTPVKVSNSWGDIPSDGASTHGMVGKVWMINHLTKERARVESERIEDMMTRGWECGGPKTKFRE